MSSEQTVYMKSKQDSRTSSLADKESDAVRRFRSCNDRVKLKEDFYKMLEDNETLVDELKSVIDICPDILMSSLCGITGFLPLHMACDYGHSYEVIELLVQRNPDALQVFDTFCGLPLHQYLSQWDNDLEYCPDLRVIKLMVDTYPLSVQFQSTHGQTSLHYACVKNCSFEIIEFLVQQYPQALQIQDRGSHTPLHKACSRGYTYKDIEFGRYRDRDVLWFADKDKDISLHKFHLHCKLSVIKLMVDTYPLSVQVQNTDGQTPLHCVCERVCSFEVIEYLVQLYPQALQMKDMRDGRTPLNVACAQNGSSKVIEFLIRQKPDVLQVADKYDYLPLHYTSQGCKLSICKLMIDTYPLSVQVHDKNGGTLLHRACINECSFEMIEFLIQAYPLALQVKDKDGHTPFHIVCMTCNNLSVMQLLHTAFPLAARWKDNDGEMPLVTACDINDYDGKLMEFIKYLAYECWPVVCPLLYRSQSYRDADCLVDATIETVTALVDVAFHCMRILPDTVIAHIIESVMPSADKSKTMKLLTKLSPGQHCELVLDKLDCHMNLDCSTVLTIMNSEELQCLLKPESGHDELQELIDNVIRMNRAGRAYFAEDPENKRQGMKVLVSTAAGLNGLFYHIRENPLVCKR